MNNIYTFFGCDSKVGTSSIIHNVALDLSKNHKNIKVIILNLDGKEGVDWIDDNDCKKCLTDLKLVLKNNIISKQNLESSVFKYKSNIHVLKGEKNISDSSYYNEEDIKNLLKLCRSCYDVILINAGNTRNINLLMTYTALTQGNNILITNQISNTYSLYEKIKKQIFNPLNICFHAVVVNKYTKNNKLEKVQDLEQKYKISVLAELPLLQEYSMVAENEKDMQLFNIDNNYKYNILKIVMYIEKNQGLSINKLEKKNGFAQFFKRGKVNV